MKVALELRYIGSAYHGWQTQTNAPSVQKTVQNAAEKLLSADCAVTGCSRTDAGVHARQYICTLQSSALDAFPIDRLPTAMNSFLPSDVSASGAYAVPEDFHPRYSAVGKEYEYLICARELRDAFLADRCWMMPGKLPDVEKMAAEAEKLCGTHDFTSFCAAGGKVTDKVRTVWFCKVTEHDRLISIRICADGFLYNMVRIIAGTLYDCGCGARGDLKEILEGRDRALAGRTAPAGGLYLDRVYYNPAELENRIKNA